MQTEHLANSVDPDRTAPFEAVWSGPTLFAQTCQSYNLGSLQYTLSNLDSEIWATSRKNQQNDCAPSEDSDQPGHLPSLVRVFDESSMGS